MKYLNKYLLTIKEVWKVKVIDVHCPKVFDDH